MIVRGRLAICKLVILLGLLSGPAFADRTIEGRVTVVRSGNPRSTVPDSEGGVSINGAHITCGFQGIFRLTFQRMGRSVIRKIVAVTGLAMIGAMAQAQEMPDNGTVISVEVVPFSEDAVNRAFVSLAEDERFVIQQRLARRGFYQGTVDGTTGPRTRVAVTGRNPRTGEAVDGKGSIRFKTGKALRERLNPEKWARDGKA